MLTQDDLNAIGNLIQEHLTPVRDDLHQEILNSHESLHQEMQAELRPIKYELRAIRHRLDNLETDMKETKSAVNKLIDWADITEHVVGVPF